MKNIFLIFLYLCFFVVFCWCYVGIEETGSSLSNIIANHRSDRETVEVQLGLTGSFIAYASVAVTSMVCICWLFLHSDKKQS
jgi:ABC-type sulfate transport system permease component